MVDPSDGMVELEKALNNGFRLNPCDLYSDIQVVVDAPDNTTRLTYVKIESGRIIAYSVFVMVEPIDNLTCFSIGYSVPEKDRNKGLGTEIVMKSIDELKKGLNRNNINSFYIEAIVGIDNIASNKIARKLISSAFKEDVDVNSGEPAYCYTRLVD